MIRQVPFLLLTLALLSRLSLAQETAPPLTFGADLYAGVSTKRGLAYYNDQLWAGQSTFVPSAVWASWERGERQRGRVSLGVGRMTNGPTPTFQQPLEAWAEEDRGNATVRVGRFFMPFAMQEWQYQPKDGIQWSQSRNNTEWSLAWQRDPMTRQSGVATRLARPLSATTTLGLSVATGQGLTYGAYKRGVGADFAAMGNGWGMRGEWESFLNSGSERFEFRFLRIESQRKQSFRPYVARYDWQETGEASGFGNYQTTLLGTQLSLSKNLSMDAGMAFVGTQRHTYLQLGWSHAWK